MHWSAIPCGTEGEHKGHLEWKLKGILGIRRMRLKGFSDDGGNFCLAMLETIHIKLQWMIMVMIVISSTPL